MRVWCIKTCMYIVFTWGGNFWVMPFQLCPGAWSQRRTRVKTQSNRTNAIPMPRCILYLRVPQLMLMLPGVEMEYHPEDAPPEIESQHPGDASSVGYISNTKIVKVWAVSIP